MECANCGISDKKERLYEVISGKGIVSLCQSCAQKGEYPIVRKPTTFQLKEAERKPRNPFTSSVSSVKARGLSSNKEDVNLRNLVEKNYKSQIHPEKKLRPDLITNFHWSLMRVRRSKKLTQAQLAKEIAESESAIKLAEQGILPENDYLLVNKLESFLGIRIRKSDVKIPERETPARIVKFDKFSLQNLKLADLKKMKEQRDNEIFGEDNFSPKEESGEEDIIEIENQDKEELSEEDIRRIIFRERKR